MLKLVKSVIAPISSLIILMMGNALFVTYTSVRLKMDGYSVNTIGYIIGAYFAGLMIGSYKCNRLIERVGHIRAYAALAASLTVLAMLQAIFQQIWMWGIIRFLSGVVIAGLFISIESWLLAKSTPASKGKVLSIYMAAFYASQGLGQLLLNISPPESLIPFAIVVILSAASIIPVSMTQMTAPIIQEKSALNIFKLLKISPLSVFTCVVSGLILGPLYGLVPIFAKNLGMDIHNISYAISATIFGGFLLQWPIGHLSDKIDRRKAIIIAGFGTAAIAIIITILPDVSNLLTFLLLALFGGFAFTIYPLGITHGSDTIESKDLIAATASLSLAYSFGAIFGPIIASFIMSALGSKGLFIYSAFIGVLLGTVSLIRIYQKSPISQEDKVLYRNLPRTSAMTPELDPRREEKEKIEEAP